MKKLFKLGLGASVVVAGALFLTGCGDSMEEDVEHGRMYYDNNKEASTKKAQWCLKKAGISEDEAKRVAELSDFKPKFGFADKVRKTGKFTRADYKNCYYAVSNYIGV